MKRILLYDSGCSTCSQLADRVLEVTGEWLGICSLRDNQARLILNRTKPNWKWEPTLLEIQDEDVRVFTGISMGFYIAWNLGPVKALRLAKLVGKATKLSWSENLVSSRRDFLKQIKYSLAGIGMLYIWSRTPQSIRAYSETISQTTQGEPYNGFLLVPDQALLPAEVKPARAIGFHGPGDYPVEVVDFSSVDALLKEIRTPIFLPEVLPDRFQLDSLRLIRLMQRNTPIIATINYTIPDYQKIESEEQSPQISLSIMFDFPRPFPIWPVHDPFSSDKVILVQPEKIIMPTIGPGILLPSRQGFVFYWMANEVCNVLVSEHSRQRASIEELAKSLTIVKN